jgi:hypothetical protein
MKGTSLAILVLCLCGFALAQSSPAYRLEEYAVNGGGHPAGGQVLASASLTMSIDAIGDAAWAGALASTSYSMDAGFGRSYPPPAEIRLLLLHGDKQTLTWDPDPSIGDYLVYRGGLAALPGDPGACRLSGLGTHTALLDDFPDTGQGYFYLVVARNRLGEDGSPGSRGDGTDRTLPVPCP